MKKTIRIIAVMLCAVLLVSAFSGCTVKFDVKLNNQPGASGDSVAVDSPATVPATTPTTITPATTTQPAASETSQDNPIVSDTAPAESSAPEESSAPAEASGELSSSSSVEEIVAEYAKVYNTTKATGTFLGHDTMTCESVIIEGKEQGSLKNLAGQFLSSDGTNMPLPPYSDDNPANECLITADDVESATYTDNGDGTATIKITPKEVVNAKKFKDPQGKMFNVMEDVAAGLANVSVISWSEGDANSNVTLTTKDGYAEVTYNKDTKMMTKAEYVLVTYADIQHCNVVLFKDKTGSAQFVYTMSYPG